MSCRGISGIIGGDNADKRHFRIAADWGVTARLPLRKRSNPKEKPTTEPAR